MRSTAHIAKTVVTPKAGLFATLGGRSRVQGNGTPKSISKLSRSAGSARRLLTALVALSALAGISLCTSAAALAEEPHPGWEVTGRFSPTVLHPGGYGVLYLYVFNTGAGQVSGSAPVLVDRLPEGLEAVSEAPASAENEKVKESFGCSGAREVTCEVGSLAPAGPFEEFEIPVVVSASASGSSGPVDLVSVRGGGAVGVTSARVPVVFGLGVAPLGFANVDTWLSSADGATDTQAGSHPYSFTVTFAMNSEGYGAGKEDADWWGGACVECESAAWFWLVKPGAVPECTREKFDGEECPPGESDWHQ